MHENLEIARSYADLHAKQMQTGYVHRYNERAKNKHFEVGNSVLILQPSSTTSRMFATWKGPGQIVEKRSPYSYVVELNGAHYRLHANELRHFRVRVEEIRIDGCYFGDPYSIPDAELSSLVVDDYLDSSEIVEQQTSTSKIALCAIIRDEDTDFGDIQTFDAGIRSQSDAVQLPSQRIDRDTSSHLSYAEQQQLLALLDKFPDVS